MDAVAIEKRLKMGEDASVEFKSVAGSGFNVHPVALAKEICAFANSSGGDILLGVEDGGSVSGIGDIKQADALMLQVAQVCQNNLDKAIWCRTTKVEVCGKHILDVEIAGFQPERPYLVNGVTYIRDGNLSRPATGPEIRRLAQSADYHFDEQVVIGATLEDLDLNTVKGFLSSAYTGNPDDVHGYLRALKCISRDGTPTVTGILFFSREPAKWLPDARVSAVRIEGTEHRADFADQKEMEGRLPEQLAASFEFLDRHLVSPSRPEGWERKERPGPGSIPRGALREAMLNALAHRDYRIASQVRVFVFDDRVEVVSPGGLLNELTLDNIRIGGISQRRNPAIATLLCRTYSREFRGVGIPEMIEEMKSNGLPEPDFAVQGNHFRVTLWAAPKPIP